MTIAWYLRLSSEDNDGTAESESIFNQRDLLRHYIHNSPSLCSANVTEFCDDGWSGKNFDRPAVKELLERTKRGEIQCILVKDISRFGRDYITVGNYITRVFPFLNVRFIAVNDNFDSSRREDIYNLDISFRALIYDMYSRDASKKVKTAKQRLAKRGVNINPVAPFGYVKDLNDRHKLVPDPRTADIVRHIFILIADGNTTEAVAKILNSEGVPPPSRFKAGTSNEHANWHNNYWCAAAVGRIARDHQYIGSFVYGKRVRPRIGAHQQLTTDLDERIIVDDCHEPLVTKELFDKAQEQLGGVMRHFHPTPWDAPLKKKVYCGVCGYAIVRKGKAQHYYRCSRPRAVPGLDCWQEKVFEDEIIEAVTEAVRYQAQVAVDTKRLWEQEQSQIEQKQRGFEGQIRECVAEQKALSAESVALYENFVDDGLTHDEYIRQKSGLVEKLEQARREETEIRSQLADLSNTRSEGIMKYQALLDTDSLTQEQICGLLERVTIFPEGRLEIKLRLVDENKTG